MIDLTNLLNAAVQVLERGTDLFQDDAPFQQAAMLVALDMVEEISLQNSANLKAWQNVETLLKVKSGAIDKLQAALRKAQAENRLLEAQLKTSSAAVDEIKPQLMEYSAAHTCPVCGKTEVRQHEWDSSMPLVSHKYFCAECFWEWNLDSKGYAIDLFDGIPF